MPSEAMDLNSSIPRGAPNVSFGEIMAGQPANFVDDVYAGFKGADVKRQRYARTNSFPHGSPIRYTFDFYALETGDAPNTSLWLYTLLLSSNNIGDAKIVFSPRIDYITKPETDRIDYYHKLASNNNQHHFVHQILSQKLLEGLYSVEVISINYFLPRVGAYKVPHYSAPSVDNDSAQNIE